MRDEVEITGDDYEVVPLTPLRKLEKRLEQIENKKSSENFERLIDKILDMTELNQRIIDEVVKANTGLREDMAVMMGKMDKLHDKIDEFVTMVKEAGETESEDKLAQQIIDHSMKPLMEQLSNANKETAETNKMMVDLLVSIEKRLKRLQPAAGGMVPPRPVNASSLMQKNQGVNIGNE